ncbi:MAG: hypothetical protein IJ769_03305, partial [Clostridia bacterium]|nr:hypothetical protein [Clostridia bacterium]
KIPVLKAYPQNSPFPGPGFYSVLPISAKVNDAALEMNARAAPSGLIGASWTRPWIGRWIAAGKAHARKPGQKNVPKLFSQILDKFGEN